MFVCNPLHLCRHLQTGENPYMLIEVFDLVNCIFKCLQYFDAVGWSAGRASGLLKTLEWWDAGMVIYLW